MPEKTTVISIASNAQRVVAVFNVKGKEESWPVVAWGLHLVEYDDEEEHGSYQEIVGYVLQEGERVLVAVDEDSDDCQFLRYVYL